LTHEHVNLRLGMAYLNAQRGEEAYRTLLLVRRLYSGNWTASVGLSVLYARSGELDPARNLIAEALQLGGDGAQTLAASFPDLTPLLER
jgi:Flp pilus assembly protein TadD